MPGIVDEEEHDHVPEERDRVEQEEHRERLGARDVCDQTAEDPADADTEVHRQPLLRERGMATARRGQARDERRLARPEGGGSRALDRDQDERLPRLADERHQPEADRLQHESAAECEPWAEAVDHRPGEDPGAELADRRNGDDEARRSQAEAADVVQVDHEEREHDPVPEGVQDAADLEEPDLARQLRIQAPDEALAHGMEATRLTCGIQDWTKQDPIMAHNLLIWDLYPSFVSNHDHNEVTRR